jgi:hypothetical protein
MKTPARNTNLVNPEADSSQNLIGVIFANSKSPSYAVTVELARSAKAYEESTIGGRLYHRVVFGLDKSEASRAVAVIDAVQAWKGTRLFARGRLLERHYNVVDTLRCYLNSLEVKDAKSHCHFVYRDLVSMFAKSETYLIPCRMLKGFTREPVRSQASDPKDAIQAAAVRRGSFWCPHFDPSKFTKIQDKNLISK